MSLGKFSYFLDFFLLPPAIIFFLWLLPRELTLVSISLGLAFFLIGFLFWTLIEYAFHRWLLHGGTTLRRLHEAHHNNPEALFGTPPLVGMIQIMLCIFLPLYFVKPAAAGAMTAGMLFGYFVYIFVHWATHHLPISGSGYFAQVFAHARRRHMVHHYRGGAANFGVTTGLWDRLFGTEHERAGQRLPG